MIIAYRCSERGSSVPRDKNSPRWNTEANLEPGVPFCEHERIRRHQGTPDKQFLARLTACGRYTFSNWGKGKRTLVLRYLEQQADHDSTHCTYSFPLQNPFSPPPDSYTLPFCILSSVSVALTTLHPQWSWGRGTRCYQTLFPAITAIDWASFLTPIVLRALSVRLCNSEQCLAISQFSMVEKSEGIYI